ncbi:hypothetical protein [Vibrio diabolicus]|uniref:hypothetical protein n=1 Tax=Vibrio sp. M60_M70 TaxID=3035166 RepID=UPI001CD9B768
MQLSLKVAMALSILASTNLYAATTLVVPEDVKLLAVNMEKPKLEGDFSLVRRQLRSPTELTKLSSNINLLLKQTKTLRQFTVT